MVYREPLTKSQLYDLYFKVIATTVALTTAVMGLVEYSQSQKLRVAAETDAAKAKVWEERLRLYDATSGSAAATATMYRLLVDESDEVKTAFSPDVRLQNYLKARGEFFRFYWGNLCLIEDRNVEYAMVSFGQAVNDAEAVIGLEALKWGVNQQESPKEGTNGDSAMKGEVQESSGNLEPHAHADRLERLSAELARVFRGSLMDTWNPHSTFEVLLGRGKDDRKAMQKEPSYGSQALMEMNEYMSLRRYLRESPSPEPPAEVDSGEMEMNSQKGGTGM